MLSLIQLVRSLKHLGTCLALSGSCLLHCTVMHAQDRDTAFVQQEVHDHSPRKATLYSVLLPGLGQVYNQKYWKVPIIYGAGGAFAYFVGFNQVKYKKFRDAYVNGEPGTPALIDGQYYDYEILPRGRDYYRRYRDLSALGFGAIYLLNIVDAMIDASFFYYDVSDDLSLQIQPVILENSDMTATLGVGIRIGF